MSSAVQGILGFDADVLYDVLFSRLVCRRIGTRDGLMHDDQLIKINFTEVLVIQFSYLFLEFRISRINTSRE